MSCTWPISFYLLVKHFAYISNQTIGTGSATRGSSLVYSKLHVYCKNNFYEILILFRSLYFPRKVFVYFVLLEDILTSIVLSAARVSHRIFRFLQIDWDVCEWERSKLSGVLLARRVWLHAVFSTHSKQQHPKHKHVYKKFVGDDK